MPRKKLRSLKGLKAQAWKVLSHHIRYSGERPVGSRSVQCYTCGTWGLPKSMHAGHAIPGRHNAVLFDAEIIRIQCPTCNLKPPYGRGGEYHIFATKLIRENSLEWWEKKLLTARQVVKLHRADFEEIITKYKVTD